MSEREVEERDLSKLLLCDKRVPCDQCAVSECVYISLWWEVLFICLLIQLWILQKKKKKEKKLNYVDKMCEKGKEQEREKKIHKYNVWGLLKVFFEYNT